MDSTRNKNEVQVKENTKKYTFLIYFIIEKSRNVEKYREKLHFLSVPLTMNIRVQPSKWIHGATARRNESVCIFILSFCMQNDTQKNIPLNTNMFCKKSKHFCLGT